MKEYYSAQYLSPRVGAGALEFGGTAAAVALACVTALSAVGLSVGEMAEFFAITLIALVAG